MQIYQYIHGLYHAVKVYSRVMHESCMYISKPMHAMHLLPIPVAMLDRDGTESTALLSKPYQPAKSMYPQTIERLMLHVHVHVMERDTKIMLQLHT